MGLKKFIPNTITSLNLCCGVLGVVFAFENHIDIAFLLMLAAALFDFLDGFAARALGAYSDMGKELDSLCDLVSFGVLPSVMMYNTMVSYTWSHSPLCYIPLLLAVFSGLRLAKFNVDERQGCGFRGLATPVSALFVGSLCYFCAQQPTSGLASLCTAMWFLPVVTAVLCVLMVSDIPMFSLKSREAKTKIIFFAAGIALIVAAVVIFALDWSIVVTLTCLFYIVKNLVYAVFKV